MYRFISLILLLWLAFTTQVNAQSVTLTVEDKTVTTGENFCLDVTVDGFDDLIILEFGITWDTTLLEFDEITNINGGAISGLSMGNFGTPPNTDNGTIRFSWDDASLSGVSAPDGTRMFQVCFNVIGSGGNSTTVNIEDVPFLSVTAIDSNEDEVPVNTVAGNVSIQGGNAELDVSITSATGNQGATVCISVRVNNFENMSLFNHALTWDTAVATFSSINNVYGGLTGLNLSNVEGPPNTPDGEIHFDWSDPTPPDGETIPDNTALYEACFELTGDPGSSTILRLESTPSQMVEAENEDGDVTVAASIGMLNINDDGSGDSDTLLVDVADITVNEGDPACVTFTVDNFTDLITAQWGITWDTLKLEFDSITNINPDLPGLNSSNFGTPPSTMNGEIRFSWDDASLQGQTLPDGSELHDVCFTAIGSGGMSSPVNVDSLDDYEIEATNSDLNAVEVESDDGSVSIESMAPDTALNILFSDATVSPGDTACIEVSVVNFEDLIVVQHGIMWDSLVLEFLEIQNINSAALQGLGPGNFSTPPDIESGTIKFSWDDPTTLGQTLADSTILYEICFIAIGGDGSSTNIDLSDEVLSSEAIKSDFNEVAITSDPGNVTIEEDDPGGTPDTLFIQGGSGSVVIGDTICVPVTVDNFEDLIHLQFGMTYNSSRLEFVSIESLNGNVDGLDLADFMAPPTSPAGQIRFTWNDPDSTGESIPDGSTLFEVCFEALGPGGTTSFFNVLGLDAFPLEAENSDTIVPVSTSNGSITIEDPVVDGDLLISTTDESGENGDTVCVDVTVENFNDLVTLQHALTWNTGILTFVSIENLNGSLSGLSMGSFSTPPTIPNGQIQFSWDDPSTEGQSLPDGAVLFSVCFEVVGDVGEMATVNVTGLPNFEIEAVNDDFDPVTVNTDSGKVTVTGIPDGLSFTVGNATGCTGDIVCVDITTNEFDNLIVFQFPVFYDSDDITPVRIENIYSTLPGFSTGSVSLATQGEVRVSWDDPNVAGQSVPDGTVLFSICFRILADDGETTDLFIQDDPDYEVEVFDNNLDQLTPMLIDGSIEVSCMADPLQVTDVTITNETCAGDMNGAIDITVEGGTPPYMYNWVGPNGFSDTTQDISGLEAGFYTVAITDSSDPAQNIIRNYQITLDGSNIELDGFSTTSVQCKGDSTGIIDLTISGVGNNPMYEWGPGTWPDSPDLIDVPAGSYQVTVTDENDCPVVFGPFTITEPFMELAITSFSTNDVDCHGESTGSIDITVEGGTPPYSYEWSHLPGMAIDPQDPQDLSTGNYVVTVTDANGCEIVSNTFTINEPPTPLSINDVTINPETGAMNNGSIEVDISGGTGIYTFSWNGPSCSPDPCTAQDLFNLVAGNYTLTLTDENGCVLVETYTVPFSEITMVVDSVIDVACEGDETGAIYISVTGGEGPFEYDWDGPDNFGSAIQDITGLGAGDYIVTITDLGAPGSTFTTTISVQTLSNLSIAASVESNYNGFGVRCFNGNDGMATVQAFNGAQPYTYLWSTGAETADLFNLAAGQYSVTVTDNVGCERVASINLTQPPFIDGEIQLMQEATCNDVCDGMARIDPVGGIAPYNIRWDNGQTTKQADSLCVGFHFVTITDFNSCDFVDSVNIRQEEIIVTHEELPDADDPRLTTIRLNVSGGTRPFEYLWEDPVEDDDNFVPNLLPGTYRVLVVDANGCEFLYEFEIESNPECFEDIRNVITPNGDGRNETFIITCADIASFTVNLEIFNRWGQLVYDIDDYQNDWNGINNDQEVLPDGVYYYIFEAEMGLGTPPVQKQGSITLLR